MAVDVVKLAQEDIKRAEDNLKLAQDLIKRLKKAGENVAELERDYSNAQARLRRYKAAFEV